jgi:hypothetical protein
MTWRQKADELFPELIARFEETDTPYLLWFELQTAFEQAYASTPRNESLIKRVYAYADWCCAQPRGRTAEDDLATCVAVCFYEHIPQHPAARADMPRWFKYEDFVTMEQIFRHHLTESEFNDLKRHFQQHRHQ